jgi:hypothetical protein
MTSILADTDLTEMFWKSFSAFTARFPSWLPARCSTVGEPPGNGWTPPGISEYLTVRLNGLHPSTPDIVTGLNQDWLAYASVGKF